MLQLAQCHHHPSLTSARHATAVYILPKYYVRGGGGVGYSKERGRSEDQGQHMVCFRLL